MINPFLFEQRIRRVLYFFPLQLLFLHLKKNHFVLLFWLVLFGFSLGFIADHYGVPDLFLYPEYLGEVNFWSFALLGFAYGGFIMAFNIYTYITHAFRFPFLATLSRPFLKFCINNFIIPTAFVITYIICSVRFQRQTELVNEMQILTNIGGLLAGMLVFILISLVYFFRTNKDIYKLTGLSPDDEGLLPVPSIRKRHKEYFARSNRHIWHVETYMSNPFAIRLARESLHYDRDMLRRVFAQNHVNATIFELVVIASFLVIGSFREIPAFVIPAAASGCLLSTMILMLASVFLSWFRGWSLTVTIGIFILLNFISLKTNVLDTDSVVYGMDYKGEQAVYDTRLILSQAIDREQYVKDRQRAIQMLEKWKKKAVAASGKQKPKMVIMNVSGGGLRSATWTMRCLQYIDSITDGQLFKQTSMVTGSSGGLIGASYFRELKLRQQSDSTVNPRSKKHIENISSDILNPILFSIATNDLFIRYQREEIQGQSYVKDRGLSFEKQLNKNTEGILDKKLMDYEQVVADAEVPMFVYSPAVVNDGRRVLMSSQPISYLTYIEPGDPPGLRPLAEDIEFNRYFRDQGAKNVRLLTTLRMSSTFPYILPNVSLPSKPAIEVMDAGLRDNMGIKSTLQFMSVFNSWIKKNTSGVVILQLRDKEKYFEAKSPKNSIWEELTNPIGSFYGNFFKEQDYNSDEGLERAPEWFNSDINVVCLELNQKREERISMSWHLNEIEKMQIRRAIDLPANIKATADLKKLLNNQPIDEK